MSFLLAVIGDYHNRKSAVTCNVEKDDWTQYPNLKLLSGTEMRDFYVSFNDNNLLKVGLEGETEPFMTHLMNCALDVRYIGIASAHHTATWNFCGFGKNCE